MRQVLKSEPAITRNTGNTVDVLVREVSMLEAVSEDTRSIVCVRPTAFLKMFGRAIDLVE